jgi:hypothetical protein
MKMKASSRRPHLRQEECPGMLKNGVNVPVCDKARQLGIAVAGE